MVAEGDRSRWMETLGYSPEWRALGILSDGLLAAQAAEWQRPDADHSAEHYRYAAWTSFASRLDVLPPALILRLLALDLGEAALAGTPSSFGHAIAYDLARHEALTVEGLALLRRHPVTAASFIRLLDRAEERVRASTRRAD